MALTLPSIQAQAIEQVAYVVGSSQPAPQIGEEAGTATLGQVASADVGLVGDDRVDPAYPNPFNPKARMCFAVKEAQPVQVILFDLQGRCLQVLMDKQVPAQTWQMILVDGSSRPNGMYLGQVCGANFVETEKRILLK